jgi:hypothetical protein
MEIARSQRERIRDLQRQVAELQTANEELVAQRDADHAIVHALFTRLEHYTPIY